MGDKVLTDPLPHGKVKITRKHSPFHKKYSKCKVKVFQKNSKFEHEFEIFFKLPVTIAV